VSPAPEYHGMTSLNVNLDPKKVVSPCTFSRTFSLMATCAESAHCSTESYMIRQRYRKRASLYFRKALQSLLLIIDTIAPLGLPGLVIDVLGSLAASALEMWM
jgi:hypothetical protein